MHASLPTCSRCHARYRSPATLPRILCPASRDSRPPRFEDHEKTIEELRARIARTIDYLKGIPASAFEGSEDRDLKVPAGPDKFLDFKGLDFLQTWAIPNVFFHITTAYAILRHNGVEIGKKDFLGGR